MDQAAQPAAVTDGVTAGLTFYVDNGEMPINYVTEKGLERGGEYRQHTLTIHDARPLGDRLTLDREGFALVHHDTAVRDFYDADEVERVYNPELERLIKQVTGATRVVVFDHTVRVEDEGDRAERKVREPVLFVHNDYTVASGPRRVRDLLPDEADELLRRRFVIINVWRSIAGPVQTTPLALCDAQTIAPENLIDAERRTKDRIGHTQAVTFNPDQRWYYFPDLQRDEVVLIKTYESDASGERTRFTAHSAFANPAAPPGAAPRESIESRLFAFFD